MKSHLYKAFLYCAVISFLITIFTYFGDTRSKAIISTSNVVVKVGVREDSTEGKKTTVIKKMKYILQWTSDSNVPFVNMGVGQNVFINLKCPYINCIVTSDKFLLTDYTMFDVIAFAGPELFQPSIYNIVLPKNRSSHQRYVFASIESSHYYPVCSYVFDGFFNWSWTYKLDSEVQWGYIVIRDTKNKIIGPKKTMHWLKDMDPVSENFKKKLKSKKKAAAWFVSNCKSRSGREKIVAGLQTELLKYNHDVDIFGRCGLFECSRDDEKRCDKMIDEDYYFYLSFENAFSEDYVTEKLLRALNNNAVPVVYGGANYTRFMPDGAYLNAVELGVKKLAAMMNELIEDPEKYAKYFEWKNHYSYHKTSDSVETNEYCRFCEILNDEKALKETTVYYNFMDWWDPPKACGDYDFEREEKIIQKTLFGDTKDDYSSLNQTISSLSRIDKITHGSSQTLGPGGIRFGLLQIN